MSSVGVLASFGYTETKRTRKDVSMTVIPLQPCFAIHCSEPCGCGYKS